MKVKVKYRFKELTFPVHVTHTLNLKIIYKMPGKLFPIVIEDKTGWDVHETGSLLHLSDFVYDQKFRRDYVLNILHRHFEKVEEGIEINAVLSGALEFFGKKSESFSFNDVELGLVRKEEDNQDENI